MDATHRRFASECFNAAWDLLAKRDRTPEEVDEMIDLAHASRWHWTQTKECTPSNLAVGAWQLSRVYAVAGRQDDALHHGQVSLRLCRDNDLSAFHEGYAYEALARAASDPDRGRYLAIAHDLASRVEDEESREALLADLATV
ncbi:hypothetical protein BMS3Abin02_01658 [bacterium BMS3Abin02]|nr:hypothetical protein BMS3Abin02_01658 [bacterium BMS3Abin02]GBE21081.1 hypothetical protein BMS3Bbin01_00422 [bacterium BMS3Bbin01]HDH24957.1 hypothetical protein [Actinomycetota bacterium]